MIITNNIPKELYDELLEIETIDSKIAFMECFKTDKERENYMYMYTKGNTHYFKHIDTREYLKVNKVI